MGEVVAACLLLLWGAATALFSLGYEPTLAGKISYYLWVIQGVFCSFSGALALLRLRSATRILLLLSAACLIALSGFGLWFAVKSPENAHLTLILSGALLFFALGYFLLGRWLGQQEDSEE